MKTEKRLLRKEEDLKLQKLLSSEVVGSTASATDDRAKAAKTAHVVLSVGNRGFLPNSVSISDIQPNRMTSTSESVELK